jgi:Cu/Ag efflux protein CusF
MTGAREGNEEFVKIALDRGNLKEETLTVALVLSSADEKKANITEMLKKAGAKPPIQVDAAILQTYAGKYKGDTGPEVTITVKDGKLFVTGFTRDAQPLLALDNTTFRPLNFGGMTMTFEVEGGKATSMMFKQGATTKKMRRTGEVGP